MPRTPLTDEKLKHFLHQHPRWALEGGKLSCTFEAATFLAGIRFVHEVAKLAEAADHHPDIDIRWRKVTLRFVTHDAGNRVTAIDARLAAECELLFDAAS